MKGFLAALFALLTLTAADAAPYPDRIGKFVSDHAQALDPATKERIANRLSEWYETSGTEVTLAIAQSRADYDPSASLESFAVRMFNGWGVGSASKNDGILVLVLLGDRNIRVALGSGYGPEWNAVAQKVIDEAFLPEFRNARIAQGIEQGIAATLQQIARPFSAGQSLSEDGTGKGFWLDKGVIAIIFTLVAVMIGFAERRRISSIISPFRKCPRCGKRSLSLSEETIHGAINGMRGKKRIRKSCSNCDWVTETEFYFSSQESRLSFGGGGGGSSSGGGASGKW